MSGNAAAQNIEGFVYISMNSVSQSALNYAGQNHGAGKFDRIRKIMLACLALAFGAGVSLGGLAVLFSRPLLSIYITDSDEAIKYGITRLMFICLPYFLCGIMDVATGMLRGIGSSVAPMFITVAGVCGFRILWIYTVFQIPKYHTLEILYSSYMISWTATFLIETVVFYIMLHFMSKHQKAKLQ